MNNTPIPACWSRVEIQVATQVDVGGLEFGDAAADAVFDAVHQSVPLGRLDKTRRDDPERVDQTEVLRDLCQPIASNEPHLRFITGKAGSGKSHLVRWLRTHIPDNPAWHVVYIEKRNTPLRRVIEQILAGIDTQAANELRHSLAQTASRLPTVREAMLALLNQLHQIIEYDETPVIDDLSGADLQFMRRQVARLIGELPFKQRLSIPGGPIERITKLAMSGIDPDFDISEDDLQISASDLEVGLGSFEDSSKELQRLVLSLVSTLSMRRATAAIINYHLTRAKAEIFTGRSADLLSVFEEVRRELALQGKELFLFIEDLVLLHGIDTQLAQALTLPTRADLCPIRAVIAVTSGHLERYTTFAERGVQYTMDVDRASLEIDDLRAFVGRYLNAGRVGRKDLAAAAKSGEPIPNRCPKCVHVDRCHATFGVTSEGHGLFPFNAEAVDNLVELASPQGFDPRNILRQVIRSPLEVAEDELQRRGAFPSARFAATLAPTRLVVPVELRNAIASRSASAEQEISLRAFYARTPPRLDDSLRAIAETLGVPLTDLGANDAAPEPATATARTPRARPNEIDQWAAGEFLAGGLARTIRTWILRALGARMQAGPCGLNVRALSSEVKVGMISVTFSNIVIPKAGGGGAATPAGPTLRFEQNDADATLFKGILSAASGNLAGPDGGAWFLHMQKRLAEFEAELIAAAQAHADESLIEALNILGVMSTVDSTEATTAAEALAVLVQPKRPADLNPVITQLLQGSDALRVQALTELRDRLTQRKGNGAPSVFDAAAVLNALLPAVRLNELSATVGDPTPLEPGMRAFRDRHGALAGQAWDAVQRLLDRLRRYIADDEDFTATADELDKFVSHAHTAGALPQRDSRARYDDLRRKATSDAFKTHRRLLKLAAAGPAPARLWELKRDPSADLNALLDYWQQCDQLLTAYRPDPGNQPSGEEVYDRERLQTALKALADSLEG